MTNCTYYSTFFARLLSEKLGKCPFTFAARGLDLQRAVQNCIDLAAQRAAFFAPTLQRGVLQFRRGRRQHLLQARIVQHHNLKLGEGVANLGGDKR
jgi:hypothetical protein